MAHMLLCLEGDDSQILSKGALQVSLKACTMNHLQL